MFLLDTNTVIYYLKASLPTNAMQVLGNIIDDQPAISVISKIELLCFNTPNINEQNITNKFVEASLIFNLDDDIINQTIALRKQYKIKLPDAIIAATALVYNLTLITHNIADFDKVPNLQLTDPHLL